MQTVLSVCSTACSEEGPALRGEKSGETQPGKSLPACIVPHTIIKTMNTHIFVALIPQFLDALLKREAGMLIRQTVYMSTLQFRIDKTGVSKKTAIQVAGVDEPFPL